MNIVKTSQNKEVEAVETVSLDGRSYFRVTLKKFPDFFYDFDVIRTSQDWFEQWVEIAIESDLPPVQIDNF